jgi:ELWxxDGT repeat protein
MSSKKVLFSANDGSHGYELWVTDGTAEGTSLVLNIDPGSTGSNANGFASLGHGLAVFDANDGTDGYELWVTNGTAAGTSLVKDIYPGALGSEPRYFTPLGNGEAVFSANDVPGDVFALPRAGEPPRLVSRAAHPHVAKFWTDDPRRLGVLIGRLTWSDGRRVRCLAIDDPAQRTGWWEVEWQAGSPNRWTDGNAMLPSLGA